MFSVCKRSAIEFYADDIIMSPEFDKTLFFYSYYIKSSSKAGKKEQFLMAFSIVGRDKRFEKKKKNFV